MTSRSASYPGSGYRLAFTPIPDEVTSTLCRSAAIARAPRREGDDHAHRLVRPVLRLAHDRPCGPPREDADDRSHALSPPVVVAILSSPAARPKTCGAIE